MEYPEYSVHPKENFYFVLKLVFSILIYVLIAFALGALFSIERVSEFTTIMIAYAVMIAMYVFFATGIMVGYIKGNGIRVSKDQFPEIYSVLEKQCEQLKMNEPPLYLMQNGGVLNAFATRFVGRNYVVIYSEIFDLAFEGGEKELNFIIAHELGHIKRNHIIKRIWLLPSSLIPFLSAAYSRACEYTCDNIGNALSPEGSKSGLLILASGKKCYDKVNVEAYINSADDDTSIWKWFAEKVSSHPFLPKRIENVNFRNW